MRPAHRHSAQRTARWPGPRRCVVPDEGSLSTGRRGREMKRLLLGLALCGVSALAAVPAASAQNCPIATGCINVNFGAVPLGGQQMKTVTLTNDTAGTMS